MPLGMQFSKGTTMATILFADANESAFRTMQRAQKLGHRTAIIRSTSLQFYPMVDWIRVTLDRAIADISLPITSDPNLMTEAVARIHRSEPIDGIIAQLEASIEATAVACARLSIPFTRAEGVLNARNKARARDLVERAGLLSARHAVATSVSAAVEIASELGYPVVAKPTSGMDSMMAYRADRPEQLLQAAEKILSAPATVPSQLREQLARGVLIEQHLPGELISAEIALLDGQPYPFIICGRSRGAANECIEMGAALPANVPPERAGEIYSYAAAACRAVGLDFGVFHVELMLSQQGPALVELNPRPMGGIMTTMYAQLTGHEFSDYIIDTYLRQPPRLLPAVGPRTITARKIMPVGDGALRSDINMDWVESLDPRLISFHNYGVRPGAAVRADQVLARYVVLSDSWTDTMRYADSLLDRFESAVGVSIHRGIPVY